MHLGTRETQKKSFATVFVTSFVLLFPSQITIAACCNSRSHRKFIIPLLHPQVNRVTIGDFDECSDSDHNDCSSQSDCINTEGSYTCKCREGFHDLSGSISLPGRVCSGEHLNPRKTCS